MSPKMVKVYEKVMQMKASNSRLLKERVNLREQLERASDAAKYLQSSGLNEDALNFISMQLRLVKKSPKGRRFTFEENVFALTLLKNSPKSYKGFHNAIAGAHKMTDTEKLCVLQFDEMSLSAGLHYNSKKDQVIGFEDLCDGDRRLKFADHALVFMLKGLCSKWKEPVAYYFTAGGVKGLELAALIRKTIEDIMGTGLNIVATVYGQYASNCAAYKQLLLKSQMDGSEETFGFKINGHEVVHFFDTPHLLKGIRNAFMKYDAEFQWRKGTQIAKWGDLVAIFEADSKADNLYRVTKLRRGHLFDPPMKKMKVAAAAQVFSSRLGAILQIPTINGTTLPVSCRDTGDFLIFFDHLFDNMNGNSMRPLDGKFLRRAIHKQSPHHKFWQEAVKVLRTIKFIGAKHQLPSVKNWVHNIKAFQYLWTKLETEENLVFLCPRTVNQDALEKFFGSVRSHGARNVNPTCAAFKNSFKSLLLSNIRSLTSSSRNCEPDECEGTLSDMKVFISAALATPTVDEKVQIGIAGTPPSSTHIDAMKCSANSYVAGYIARTLRRNVRCETCCNSLVGGEPDEIVAAVQYKENALCSPQEWYLNFFNNAHGVLVKIITSKINRDYIMDSLSKELLSNTLLNDDRFTSSCCHGN